MRRVSVYEGWTLLDNELVVSNKSWDRQQLSLTNLNGG